jgi:hypothetical protein
VVSSSRSALQDVHRRHFVSKPLDAADVHAPGVFGVREFAFELMHALLHLRTGLQGAKVPFLSLRIVTMTASNKFLRGHRYACLAVFGSAVQLGSERTSDNRANAAVALACEPNQFVSLPAIDLRPNLDAILLLAKLTHLHF